MKKQEKNSQEKQDMKKQKLYTKDVVLKSKRFLEYRDILNVKLNEHKLYTMKELENIVKEIQ